jgi:two-component system sensor histidine kinase GlrK
MSFRPRSILRLILYGFALVSLPLMFAVGYAVVYVERLSADSQDAVYQAVQAVQNSHLLSQQIIDMERNARQYLVLRDPDLLKAYQSNRSQFIQGLQALNQMALDPELREQIAAIQGYERKLNQRLQGKPGATASTEVAAMFSSLRDMMQGITVSSNRLIDHEVQGMRQAAQQAQRMLFWLTAALLPVAMLFAAIFAILISRPISQLEHAIQQLGAGDFEEAIAVRGPRDIEKLGGQLDWLRARLLDLEGQKTTFLQHMSHELKTPLTAIREGSQILSDELGGPLTREQREIVSILSTNSFQLQRLIEDLLNFSTSQAHTPQLYISRVAMDRLVETVVRNHKPAAMTQNLDLDLRLEPVRLNGDEEKLRTVVDNLLGNAIKFSPKGGNIVVSLQQANDYAVLDVLDEGPGIAPQDRSRVFDAFYQGRNRASGYVKGSGLGLAIAREYVRAHRGSIDVIDNGQKGAHLRVLLPTWKEALA